MSVLEFIAAMTSALAWPAVAGGAVVLLRKQIKTAADKLVSRIGEISHLKAGAVSVDFEREAKELAEATEELQDHVPKALPATWTETMPKALSETAEQRLTKYQQLAILDPKAAVLSSFADLEGPIRRRFRQLYPDERRGLGFNRIIDILQRDGWLDAEIAMALRRMAELRNAAAHEAGPDLHVNTEVANYFVESVGNTLGYLLLSEFFEREQPKQQD